MNLTSTAYGTWSGGKFMHFGEAVDDARYLAAFEKAHAAGIRTFVTADAYGGGRADEALGEGLAAIARQSYCLVGMVGHDFYHGTRKGSAGYPRFTDPSLRGADGYADYLRLATEKSLQRCRAEKFDLLMLHNPDQIGYTRAEVWEAMRGLREAGLTERLGIAPGPANGFTLDLIHCFETYGEVIDWAMIILNPNEPWPGRLVLPAAEKAGVQVLARVVDHGGIFWGDVRPGHAFREGDHRAYRPQGWVEEGNAKKDAMQEVADRHGLSPIHFASAWCLSQTPVTSVVPTVIQEAGEDARPFEDKLTELGALPDARHSAGEVEAVARAGDNTGCMALKGASQRHSESTRPDEWPMRDDLLEVAHRHGLGSEW